MFIIKKELNNSSGISKRKIWVDADACPVSIKEILFRAAKRTESEVTLVANKFMRIPDSPFLHFVLVKEGPDVADEEIESLCTDGDLVITADIPLAAKVIDKGAQALNPSGEFYTRENVKNRLSTRDFMAALRSAGVETDGPKPFSDKNKHRFAAQLDKFLSQKAI